MYWDFSLGSVIHCLLAWSEKNKPASSAASDVAAAPAIVVVGSKKKEKASVDSVGKPLHEPLKGTVESLEATEDAEEPVGNGSTPVPNGTDLEMLTPVLRGADSEVLVLVLRGAEPPLIFEVPVHITPDDPAPPTLDDPKLPLFVIGYGAESPVPRGTGLDPLAPLPSGAVELLFEAPAPAVLDDPVLPLLAAGYGVVDRLPGLGYGASEGIAAGWNGGAGAAVHS